MFVVRITNDYSQYPYSDALTMLQEDREALKAYGSIRSEEEKTPGVKIWTVEFEKSDGWDARGQLEETLTSLRGLPSWERVQE